MCGTHRRPPRVVALLTRAIGKGPGWRSSGGQGDDTFDRAFASNRIPETAGVRRLTCANVQRRHPHCTTCATSQLRRWHARRLAERARAISAQILFNPHLGHSAASRAPPLIAGPPAPSSGPVQGPSVGAGLARPAWATSRASTARLGAPVLRSRPYRGGAQGRRQQQRCVDSASRTVTPAPSLTTLRRRPIVAAWWTRKPTPGDLCAPQATQR